MEKQKIIFDGVPVREDEEITVETLNELMDGLEPGEIEDRGWDDLPEIEEGVYE